MMLLLVLHYGRERAPQPFLLERVRNRALVPNAQLFHWAPPFSHCAERARERRKDLAPHLPLQLLHLCVDYQVNRFVGCDCHIEGLRRYLKMYAGVEAHIEEPGWQAALWSLGE